MSGAALHWGVSGPGHPLSCLLLGIEFPSCLLSESRTGCYLHIAGDSLPSILLFQTGDDSGPAGQQGPSHMAVGEVVSQCARREVGSLTSFTAPAAGVLSVLAQAQCSEKLPRWGQDVASAPACPLGGSLSFHPLYSGTAPSGCGSKFLFCEPSRLLLHPCFCGSHSTSPAHCSLLHSHTGARDPQH